MLGGSKMVEDSQIKAEVSPFAIREGEIKVFDGKDGYVSMNQIIHKNHLLKIVKKYFFISSPLIYYILSQ